MARTKTATNNTDYLQNTSYSGGSSLQTSQIWAFSFWIYIPDNTVAGMLWGFMDDNDALGFSFNSSALGSGTKSLNIFSRNNTGRSPPVL